MLNKIKSYFSRQPQEKQVQNLNILLAICAFIIVTYCIVIWRTTDVFKLPTPATPQIILVHSDNNVSNILDAPVEMNSILKNTNNIDTIQYLDQGKDDKIALGDVVIIKFFEIQGVIVKIDAPWAPTVSVLYKDQRGQLHIISLDTKFNNRPPA